MICCHNCECFDNNSINVKLTKAEIKKQVSVHVMYCKKCDLVSTEIKVIGKRARNWIISDTIDLALF